MRPILVCASLSVLIGCGERLSSQSDVDKLRLLAIRADKPEVAPGETVRIEALWADPLGDGRPVDFAWAACALGPGASAEACTAENGIVLGIGDGLDVVDVDVPPTVLPEGVDETSVIVTLFLCAGGFSDETMQCSGESVTGYKRVTISQRDALNQNPAIGSVRFDGRGWADTVTATIPVCPSGDCPGVEIVLEPEPGAAETYVEETPEGPAETREELIVSFFTTAGDLGDVRAVDPRNERFTVAFRAPPEPGPFTMWFVLRDGRGGTSWIERAGEAL